MWFYRVRWNGSALCLLRICTHSSAAVTQSRERFFPKECRPLRALMEADLISHYACGEMVCRNIRSCGVIQFIECILGLSRPWCLPLNCGYILQLSCSLCGNNQAKLFSAISNGIQALRCFRGSQESLSCVHLSCFAL